jgi:hypothetical protein
MKLGVSVWRFGWRLEVNLGCKYDVTGSWEAGLRVGWRLGIRD